MLDDMTGLENLCIRLPRDDELLGFDLPSDHPHLHTFSFCGERLPSSFLRRHPTIKRLNIDGTSLHTLEEGDMPRLKTLSSDGRTFSTIPGWISPLPVTNLILGGIDEDALESICSLVEGFGETLRQIQLRMRGSYVQWTGGLRSMLHSLPLLEELRVSAFSFNEENIVSHSWIVSCSC
jgi:hypothetical protein